MPAASGRGLGASFRLPLTPCAVRPWHAWHPIVMNSSLPFWASPEGTLPAGVLKKGAESMVKHSAVPPEPKAQLQADFARNNTRDMRRGLQAYLRWLRRDDDRARRLCETDVPAWVVHAEKGDGGLTQHERAMLEACRNVRVVTIPGQVFFLPNEVPERIADVIVQALAEA